LHISAMATLQVSFLCRLFLDMAETNNFNTVELSNFMQEPQSSQGMAMNNQMNNQDMSVNNPPFTSAFFPPPVGSDDNFINNLRNMHGDVVSLSKEVLKSHEKHMEETRSLVQSELSETRHLMTSFTQAIERIQTRNEEMQTKNEEMRNNLVDKCFQNIARIVKVLEAPISPIPERRALPYSSPFFDPRFVESCQEPTVSSPATTPSLDRRRPAPLQISNTAHTVTTPKSPLATETIPRPPSFETETIPKSSSFETTPLVTETIPRPSSFETVTTPKSPLATETIPRSPSFETSPKTTPQATKRKHTTDATPKKKTKKDDNTKLSAAIATNIKPDLVSPLVLSSDVHNMTGHHVKQNHVFGALQPFFCLLDYCHEHVTRAKLTSKSKIPLCREVFTNSGSFKPDVLVVPMELYQAIVSSLNPQPIPPLHDNELRVFHDKVYLNTKLSDLIKTDNPHLFSPWTKEDFPTMTSARQLFKSYFLTKDKGVKVAISKIFSVFGPDFNNEWAWTCWSRYLREGSHLMSSVVEEGEMDSSDEDDGSSSDEDSDEE
jgi:hypothetical protein